MINSDIAVQNNFRFEIDGASALMTTFQKCEGLTATYAIKAYEEGGQNGYVHQLPGRLSYENISLTRAVCGESMAVAKWFASFGTKVTRSTARISALGSNGAEIATWNLMGVIPVSYSVAGAEAGTTGALTETLVLSHEGFADLL